MDESVSTTEATTESSGIEPTFVATSHDDQVSSSHEPTTPSVDESTANPPQIDDSAEWSLTEDLIGQGEKPEWFNNKTFKTVSDQAKAYPELQKLYNNKLQGFTGAPEDGYTFELSEELTEAGFDYDANNAYFKDFAEACKESGMNQETFQKSMDIATNYLHSVQQSRVETINNAIDTQMEEELNTLDKSIKDEFVQYVDVAGNLPGITSDELNHFVDNLNDAQLVKTFNKMMASTRVSQVPTSNSAPSLDTHESLRLELKRVHSMPRGPARDLAQQQLNERYSRMV